MSAQPEPRPIRHLRLIDTDTGEIVDDSEPAKLQERVEKLEADRKALERDLRAKRRRITELERDKVRERLEHPSRDQIEAVHDYWQRRMGSTGALTPARFDAVAGILEQQRIVAGEGRRHHEPAYAYPEDFKRAIDGCWHDHFVKLRKNGTEQHFTDLELICRDGKQFEEFIARCPIRRS